MGYIEQTLNIVQAIQQYSLPYKSASEADK